MVNSEMPKVVENKEIEEDGRFKMAHPDFEVNRFSEEYMLRHPHLRKQLEREKQ